MLSLGIEPANFLFPGRQLPVNDLLATTVLGSCETAAAPFSNDLPPIHFDDGVTGRLLLYFFNLTVPFSNSMRQSRNWLYVIPF